MEKTRFRTVLFRASFSRTKKNSLAPLKEPTYEIWSQSVHMKRLCWEKTQYFGMYIFLWEKRDFERFCLEQVFHAPKKQFGTPQGNHI